MGAPQKQTIEQIKRNEAKWTKPLMEAGFTVLPTVLIQRQKALHLEPLDINIVLHLASYWWDADRPPYPAKKTIADAVGVTPRSVQRRIANLEKMGLIKRVARSSLEAGQQSNLYTFDGLIEMAKPYAEEEIARRKKAKDEAEKARKRRLPVRLVKSGRDEE